MSKPTDFDIELERLTKEIAELESCALSPPVDSEKATRYVYRLYQRASLTGDLAELAAAGRAINRAIEQLANPSDLYFLKANLDFKFHRLAEVKNDLESSPHLRASPQGRALQADLDFQEGRYDEARAGYEAVIRDDRSWDGLARLAYFHFKMGDIAVAEQLYAEAEDELTAKEMRHFAWLELQRGLLDLSRGQYEEAQLHYERAERAYSGHWLVTEHLAELLAARGEFDGAVALYEQVIARCPRPDFQQALGELYDFMGQSEQAKPWYEKALTAYLTSARHGEVHYYHHLADFYTDAHKDAAEAVQWARQDVALRENFSTLAALAWALYHNNQLTEAVETMNRALDSGVKDAHLFSQAATIYRAAGATVEGNQYWQWATELSPHCRNFHVHR